MNRPLRVLVVDDDPAITGIFIRMLQSMDYNLSMESASSLSEALEKLKDDRIQVVTLDLSMSDCSGIEAVKAVSKSRPDVLIVVITAMDECHKADCVRAGADLFFQKPVESWKTVVDMIRQAVIRREVAEQFRPIQESLDRTQKTIQEAEQVLERGKNI